MLNGACSIVSIHHVLEERIASYHHEELGHALQFMTCVKRAGDDLSLDAPMDDQLRDYLFDLLDYGVTRYVVGNGDELGFKLWQNYRMDQVQLKLLKNPGYNAVGTYYYENYVVIFASLKKDLPTEDKLNYQDKFLQGNLFQWESLAHLPMSDLSKLNSNRFAYLFIRKISDENGIVLPFTYVGRGKLSNCRKMNSDNGTYLFDVGMENELPDYLQYDFGLTK